MNTYLEITKDLKEVFTKFDALYTEKQVAYYLEKKEDMPRALSFYKMAYEKNPTDMYNIFSYARVLDIQQDNEALSLYKNILSKVDNSHPLYATTHKRVMELGN